MASVSTIFLNGEWVPSITSVTSFYNRQIFAKWRARVGIEEANRITKKATTRGTDFHEAVELYMLNKEIDWDEFRPLTKFMFHHATPYLDRINNIHAIERTLFSEYLGLAGRVDCIAEYEGELAVIDFKTSEKNKTRRVVRKLFRPRNVLCHCLLRTDWYSCQKTNHHYGNSWW